VKVDSLELWHVEVPLEETFRPAWIPGYPQTHNKSTLARIGTDEGVTGIAAGAAFGREREGLADLLGNYMMGLDPMDVDAVRQRLRELSYLGWDNRWLEAAFWDIQGKARGVPIWRLLAGPDHEAPQAVDVYCSSGERRDPQEAAAFVEDRQAEGFEAVKLRPHAPDLDEDVAVLEAARQAAQPHVDLMADANQGWVVDLFGDAPRWDPERARAFAEAAAEHDLAWLEEPLPMEDVEDLAELREAVDVPVAGGELATSRPLLDRYRDHDALDVYQPDCAFSGISLAREVQKWCQANDRAFTPHTWTNGLGMAANLHVHATQPDPPPLEFPHDPPAWTPAERDAVLASPLLPDKGTLPVPREPGLGVSVDEDTLEDHGHRFCKATPARVAVDLAREKGLSGFWEILRQKIG
jgi:L-alanine-DL-glutamate epimerase-like enolase superfamily enzyme